MNLARVLIGIGLVGAAFLLPQCVDTTPLDYHAPPTPDATVPDGSGLDNDADTPCRECLTDDKGPCASILTDCQKLEKCPKTVECLLDLNCFDLAALQDRITCGLPCLTANGVLAGSDPATQVLAQLNVCAVNSCSSVCATR
jgi:hypothetical protein